MFSQTRAHTIALRCFSSSWPIKLAKGPRLVCRMGLVIWYDMNMRGSWMEGSCSPGFFRTMLLCFRHSLEGVVDRGIWPGDLTQQVARSPSFRKLGMNIYCSSPCLCCILPGICCLCLCMVSCLLWSLYFLGFRYVHSLPYSFRADVCGSVLLLCIRFRVFGGFVSFPCIESHSSRSEVVMSLLLAEAGAGKSTLSCGMNPVSTLFSKRQTNVTMSEWGNSIPHSTPRSFSLNFFSQNEHFLMCFCVG